MLLDSLPIEILHSIINHVRIGERSYTMPAAAPIPSMTGLYTLCLVNRFFSRLVPKVLYERIHIGGVDGSRWRKLIRSLTNNPSLGSLIRSLDVGYSAWFDQSVAVRFHARTRQLLQMLTQLRDLRLRTAVPLYSGDSSLLDIPVMQKIENFHCEFSDRWLLDVVSHHISTTQIVQALLDLSSLKSATFKYYGTDDVPSISPDRISTSTIRHLRLWNSDAPWNGFRELLLCPRALETFTCILKDPRNGIMRPWETFDCLNAAQNTLTEIHISVTNWPEYGFITTDGSMAEFRSFKALKVLDLFSTFIFLNHEQDAIQTRNGLYGRLPNSLEILKIIFPVDVHGSADTLDSKNSGYTWISELATNKKQFLPNLMTVHLEEQCGRQVPSVEVWKHPVSDDLTQSFNAVGIDLKMLVSPERHWVE